MNPVFGPKSPKSKTVTLFLAVLVGTFGVDRFYLGKIGTGIIKCITLGALGFWTIYDIAMIAMGEAKDKQGRYVV